MLPVILMLVVAPIGALDVLYFHIWKFRLYREPSARAETVTHLIRGFLFGAGAWLISSYRLDGAWFWAVAVVLLVDFVNEIADVALEGESRAPLGGLPTLESVIHIIGATFAGATAVAFAIAGWSRASMETALVSNDGAWPASLVWGGRLLAVGSFAMTFFELGLFVRSFSAAPKVATAT